MEFGIFSRGRDKHGKEACLQFGERIERLVRINKREWDEKNSK